MSEYKFPLMADNITSEDIRLLIEFLEKQPRLTQSKNVRKFEEEWSNWLGVKYSVYVNSGASANILTLAALKHLKGSSGEVIVSPLNWVSDISACILNGFTPVFVDINPHNLALNDELVLSKLNENTKAVLLTHIQGFNGLTDMLLDELKKRNILLIEDVCESYGATFKEKKCGSFGWASNFSFYFAHHMSTIEGGMISTNDPELYEVCRMLRSHGMVRECTDTNLKYKYEQSNPDLNPDFIFAYPAYNCRGTEIGGVIGRSQLKRLDANNKLRNRNWNLFLSLIRPDIYRTDFNSEGSCNYAFALVIKEPNFQFRDKLEKKMRESGIEFRRGSSGGGNQLRQPYLKKFFPNNYYLNFPQVEHIHHFGYYIGNYPALTEQKIIELCKILNSV